MYARKSQQTLELTQTKRTAIFSNERVIIAMSMFNSTMTAPQLYTPNTM